MLLAVNLRFFILYTFCTTQKNARGSDTLSEIRSKRINNIEPETVRAVSAEQSNIISFLLVSDKAEQLVIQKYKIILIWLIYTKKKAAEIISQQQILGLFFDH